MLREIVRSNSLPDYRLVLNFNDIVTIFTKDSRKLARAVLGKSNDVAPVVLSPTE